MRYLRYVHMHFFEMYVSVNDMYQSLEKYLTILYHIWRKSANFPSIKQLKPKSCCFLANCSRPFWPCPWQRLMVASSSQAQF